MNTKHTTLKYAEEPSLDDLCVVRKFNEWMLERRDEPVPKMHFGPLWREGEMAVLTGDPGSGKSLLAVQIAESIAGGRKFGPFEMTAKPQEVLYLNLKLTSTQFKMRYAAEHDADDPDTDGTLKHLYKFSKKLHRVDINIHAKLPEGYKTFDEVLPVLVERLVHKHKAKVVIIDNITYLQRSVYGYRETFTIMKELDALKRRLGISILVLARTSKYGGNSAASCAALFSRFADSVFMTGTSRLDPSVRFIKQLIVHSSQMIYNSEHVASFVIERAGGNFLSFRHYGFHTESEHRSPVSDEHMWPTSDKVKTLSESGKSIREIAGELDLPKSSVHRYLQMWTAEIGASMKRQTRAREPYDKTKGKYYFPGREEYDEAKNDPKFNLLYDTSIPDEDPRYRLLMREYGIIDNASYRASQVYKNSGTTPKLNEDKQYAEFTKIVSEGGNPFAYDSIESEPSPPQPVEPDIPTSPPQQLLHPALNGLKHSLDPYGKDIWIIKENERGKTIDWYSFDSNRKLQRHTHDGFGVKITRDKDPDKMA